MSGRFVDANGIALHLLEHGSTGPTLLLLPGLTANVHSFDGLVAAGLAERMHVLALDLRGRGLSDKPDSGYTMQDHADDVLGVLDVLGLDRVSLVGHSYGGLLAYYLAAHHPDRVERCVAIDAPADVDEKVLDQIKPSLDRLDMVLPSWDAYLEMAKGMSYYVDWWDPVIEQFYRADIQENADGTVQPRSKPEHIFAAVEGTLAVDWPSMVGDIRCPLLFLRAPGQLGPGGPLVREEQARATIAFCRDAELRDVVGNHLTCLFGDGAPIVVDRIEQFVLGSEGASVSLGGDVEPTAEEES